jgi:DNA-binding MarR family transcriptional regulator
MEYHEQQGPASLRDQLIEDALDELTQHGPPGMIRSIRRWSSGRLSMVNLHVLMLLVHEGPLRMHAIAESLDVSQASTTGIIDRMEELGYVARERDEDDRRAVNVVLTEAGRQLVAGMATERRERIAALLEGLTDDELTALATGLRALRLARERIVSECTDQAHRSHGQTSP